MHYHRKPEWAMPEREATPESIFMNRRKFLAGSAGVVAGGILGGRRAVEAGGGQGQGSEGHDLGPLPRQAESGIHA